jgi:hypothetical protein
VALLKIIRLDTAMVVVAVLVVIAPVTGAITAS